MRRKLVTGITITAVILAAVGALVLQQSSTQISPAAVSRSVEDGLPPSASSPRSPATTPPGAVPAPKQGPPSTAVPSPKKTVEPGEADPVEPREADPVAPDAGPGTLPDSKPLAALVTLPLPDTASAVGSIVAGFPTRVIPEAPHSSVGTSSVAAEGSHLQATLAAQTTLTVVEVMDFYRTALAKLGLYDTPAPALDGSTALTFNRGNNTVTISVTAIDGGSRYVVFGAFSAST
ncbi:hypothetical protein [Cryobacterium fucosi]|uniref:Uncharacterized protein n=1 Tax=Cryobacterium fucosi TaxID=1259157 RepID=A0A4R9BAX8_9MICO|nr:hypothetical protein [Cryobacterium fucosi]TFD79419.1 hypothetical protein E3T48_05690 [Cryobacterium fucosi]